MKSVEKYFIIILIGCVSNLISQNAYIDSLSAAIKIEKVDTLKVNQLVHLASAVYSYSLEESLQHAEKAIELSQKNGYEAGIAKANFQAGYALMELGRTEDALNAGLVSADYYNSQKDSSGIASANNLTGMCYLRLGDTELALAKLFEATQISEHLDNPLLSASSYNNLAEVYGYSNDGQNAKKYYLRSFEFLQRTNDSYRKAIVSMNIANESDLLEEKIEYLNQSIKFGEEGAYSKSLAYSYGALGDVYMYSLNDHQQALDNYHKGLNYAKLSGDYRMEVHGLTHIAASWLELGNPDSANKYIELVEADRLEDNYLREFLYYKARTKQQLGQYDLGFSLLDSTLKLHINHFDQDLAEMTSEANAKFETEKKEKEIVQQQLMITKQKNNRNIILVTGALLFAIVSILAQYFINRQKRQKKETELALSLEKQRANDLEELSNTKTNLFNNISHELRTPLTMIIGPLEQASKKIKNVQVRKEVDLALNNSNRLTNLVNEILDLSKLDSGKIKIENTKINLTTFLKRVVHAFSSLASSQNINLEDNLPQQESSIFIETDVQKLEKILNNLISNSIKYSKDGGTVSLHLDQESLEHNRLKIAVQDEGVGIPTEDQHKIFDRYFQSTHTAHISGTGIGLALTKELCHLLGGTIEVVSQPHIGSRFTFEIPIKKSSSPTKVVDSIQVESQETSPNPLLIKGKKPEILIVEDDLQMANYLRSLLSDYYDCSVTHNGRQAMEMLNRKAFDLISSDVMMPEMDGFEFREKINQDSRLKNTPFILLTARVLEEDKLKGFQLGIDDYITKPFGAEELKARIRNLIQNKVSRSESALDLEVTYEESLMEKAQNAVLESIDNPRFSVKELASALNYSSRQLGRVLKKATGLTPVGFILEIRLQTAYRIIQERKFSTLNEVRHEVGMESASYFSSKFKERFGLNPSEVGER